MPGGESLDNIASAARERFVAGAAERSAGPMPAHPESARLRYRPASAADVPALVAHWNLPDVRRHLWDDQRVATEIVQAVVATSEEDFARAGFGLWILSCGSVAAPAGFCGLRPVPGTDHVEVLYSLDPALWGRGLATEAARAVLAYGFGLGGARRLPRILGGADAANAASWRVLERLGMTEFGTLTVGETEVRYLAVSRQRFLAAGRR